MKKGWPEGPPVLFLKTERLSLSLVSETTETDRLVEFIDPMLQSMGYEIVRVLFTGAGRRTLQIMIDRDDGKTVTVDECGHVSRSISTLLDVADPGQTPYDLEVSSPGIDRPLTRRRDFDRFTGFEAKIELKALIEGRRRFRGRLKGVAGDFVRLDGESGEIDLPFDAIQKAKLVVTDELLAAFRAKGPRPPEKGT